MKTRLCLLLSSENAAELYEAMLLDTLERTAQIAPQRWLFHASSAGAEAYFARTAPEWHRREQAAGDLGRRMAAALAEVFSAGAGKVVIIGSDSPDVPTAHIEDAFRLLDEENVDAVVGPSEDGGYYLVGMKQVYPELFTGIPWSSTETLSTTLRQAERAGIGMALLPMWYDLDEPADLVRESLVKEECPAWRTRQFLIRHREKAVSRGDAEARR